MWIRKRIDIGWRDLAFGLMCCCWKQKRAVYQERIERTWSSSADALACLSVRSGFDLLLEALALPERSEILVSAVTIPDMVRIIEKHGLVPVPIDLDAKSFSPRIEQLAAAVTPRTRAILVAHLFGGRLPLDALLTEAKRHNLLVIEDCAQAFGGRRYRGDPRADVSMFSFGPIKTATALGGAVLRVRDPQLLEAMRRRQSEYPVQSRWTYMRRLLKYAGIRLLSTRAMFSLLVRVCKWLGVDHDRLANSAARGFAGPNFFERIRQQPCGPLFAMLYRRLATFDPERLDRRSEAGEILRRRLSGPVECPGAAVTPHSHWVFPVLTANPACLIDQLAKAGFDATQGQSLCIVAPPLDRPELYPSQAKQAFDRLVYLPLYSGIPDRELLRMAEVVEHVCHQVEALEVAAPPLTRHSNALVPLNHSESLTPS